MNAEVQFGLTDTHTPYNSLIIQKYSYRKEENMLRRIPAKVLLGISVALPHQAGSIQPGIRKNEQGIQR